MYKSIIYIFLLSLINLYGQSNEKITIPGFGELPLISNTKTFSIDFGKLGKFQFTGTLNPLNLITKANIEQLVNFPGYKLYSNLGLSDIELNVSPSGLDIFANANTQESLGVLFKFFKIAEPQIGFGVSVAKDGFSLSGALDFNKNPIVIDIKGQTRFTLQKFEISAELGGDETKELEILVNADVKFKPTKVDPDLQTVLAFSYNLKSQELSIAGSITDTWKNPFGISKLFKNKEVISLENTAIEIGWVPGTPTPTTIGFALEKGQFFQLDFGIIMSLSLDDGKVALKANRNEMTMNDLITILRDGFGLKVPDIFPKDIYIKDAEILFSPAGGEVGESEINQGFTLKGTAKLMDAINANVDFYANMDDGFYLDFYFDNSLKDKIKNELKNVKVLSKVINPLLSTFQLRQAKVYLEAGMDLNLAGKTHFNISIFNKPLPIPDMEASFDFKKIVKHVVDKIVESKGGKLVEISKNIGASAQTAGRTIGQGAKFAKKVVTLGVSNAKHLHPKGILHPVNKHVCREQCIPNRANELIGKVLHPSLNAIQSFYDNIIDDIVILEGDSFEQTKSIREAFFLEDWNNLNQKIENDWKSIWEDKFYYGLFIRKSAAIEGGNIYRAIITDKKQEYLNLKNKIYNDLINLRLLPVIVKYDRKKGCGTFYANGQPLKEHCGWRKNWHTMFVFGNMDKVFFYDNNSGVIEIYSLDKSGNMSLLKHHNGIRKSWSSINWIPYGLNDGVIKFEDSDGNYELYNPDDNGNIIRQTNLSLKEILPEPIIVKYNSEKGCGAFYSNGKLLKEHCGWNKTWHTIFIFGNMDKVFFYDKNAGSAQIYKLNGEGDMNLLKLYNNFRKDWDKISWISHNETDGVIKFEKANGLYELYQCDNNGNIVLDSYK